MSATNRSNDDGNPGESKSERKAPVRLILLLTVFAGIVTYSIVTVENVRSPSYPEGNLYGLAWAAIENGFALLVLVGVVVLARRLIRFWSGRKK